MNSKNKETLRFSLNLSFDVYNCILGVISSSLWFLTIGAYYIILSMMRISVIRFYSKNRKNEVFRCNDFYFIIGFMFYCLYDSGAGRSNEAS